MCSMFDACIIHSERHTAWDREHIEGDDIIKAKTDSDGNFATLKTLDVAQLTEITSTHRANENDD